MNEIVLKAEINEETGDIAIQAYRVDGDAYTPVVLKARPGGMVVAAQPTAAFSEAHGNGQPAAPGPVASPSANLPAGVADNAAQAAELARVAPPAERAPGYGELQGAERPGHSPMQEPVGGRVEPLANGGSGVVSHAAGIAMSEADIARARMGAQMQPAVTTPVDPEIAEKARLDAERQEEADRRAALEQARLGADSGHSGHAPGTQIVGA